MIFDNCHSNALICLLGDTTLIQYHSYVYRMRFKSCLLTYFACPTLKYNGLSKYFWSVIVASHISILTLYTQGCPNVEVTNQYIACIHITRLKLNFEYMQNTLLIDEAKLSVHWKSYSGVFPNRFPWKFRFSACDRGVLSVNIIMRLHRNWTILLISRASLDFVG